MNGDQPASTNPYDLDIAAELYDSMVTHEADVAVFLQLAESSGGPILELACGTGRCIIPLIRAGFDVVGIDSSKAMLRVLKRKTAREPEEVRHRSTPLREDSRSFSVPLRFGMSFIAANSFGLFLTREDQENFLSNVFLHLRPGGLLAIDMFNPDYARLQGTDNAMTSVKGCSVTLERLSVDRCLQTIRSRTSYHRGKDLVGEVEWEFRYVFRFELELLVEKAGFEVLQLWGDYDRNDFGTSDGRLFLVARKPFDRQESNMKIMRARAPVEIAGR